MGNKHTVPACFRFMLMENKSLEQVLTTYLALFKIYPNSRTLNYYKAELLRIREMNSNSVFGWLEALPGQIRRDRQNPKMREKLYGLKKKPDKSGIIALNLDNQSFKFNTIKEAANWLSGHNNIHFVTARTIIYVSLKHNKRIKGLLFSRAC